MLGLLIDAISPDIRVVSVQGGPHALIEAYVNFLGSGYEQKLIDIQHLTSAFSNVAFNGLRQVFPIFWTRTL